MATTQVSDVVVPDVFNPYVVERTAELSALVQSGIISQDEQLNILAQAGGKLINMPFWSDLSGDDEVLADGSSLSPAAMSSGKDIAVLLMRGKAWSVNDLAAALSGDDPMRAVGDLVASYWARKEQTTLINILDGAMAGTNMGDKVHDISGEADGSNEITASTFLDAQQLMGDAKDRITAVAMHSAVATYLAKNDLIDFLPDSEGKPTIKTFLGNRVIEDDGLEPDTEVYTTYLFGEGAVGRGDGEAPVPTETDRDSLAGDNILITRRHYLLHPRGVKFTSSSVAGESPKNDELADSSNWERVYDPKNIRIVQFKHKV